VLTVPPLGLAEQASSSRGLADIEGEPPPRSGVVLSQPFPALNGLWPLWCPGYQLAWAKESGMQVR
jgi:hypothetical protein